MIFYKYFLFLFFIFCNQVGARDLLTVATSPDNPPFEFYREGKLSTSEIANMLGISKSTLYSYLQYRGVKIGIYRHK